MCACRFNTAMQALKCALLCIHVRGMSMYCLTLQAITDDMLALLALHGVLPLQLARLRDLILSRQRSHGSTSSHPQPLMGALATSSGAAASNNVAMLVDALKICNGESKLQAAQRLCDVIYMDEFDCANAVSAGAIPLLEACLNGPEGLQGTAAQALSYLYAYGGTTPTAIVAVAPLVACLSSPSDFVRDWAAEALYRACNHPGIPAQAVAAGAITPLITCLSSCNGRVQASAAWALSALCEHTNTKAQMVAAGAIPALTACLSSGSTDLQEAVAVALGSVVFKANKRILESAADAIPCLVPCLASTSARVVEGTLWVLLHLSDHFDDLLGTEGATQLIVACLSSSHVKVQEHAGALLCRLAAYLESDSPEIADWGAIPPLVSWLSSSNMLLQERAAGILYILSYSANRHMKAAADSALLPLVACLSSGSNRVRDRAAGVLQNVCKEFKGFGFKVVASGAIPQLVNNLSSMEEGVRRMAAGALHALCLACTDKRVERSVIAAGTIAPLVGCLSSMSYDTKAAAVLALRALASHPEVKSHILEASAEDDLYLFRDGEHEGEVFLLLGGVPVDGTTCAYAAASELLSDLGL